ncbi:MAG: polymerase sigma-B factor, partial [Pseudonocardiales bacterium]|nr:polymerase sigma-B factor [Pseudonocardiales bacterium]
MLAAISVEPAQDVKAPAPSSEYAEQMPRLRYYASLPSDDPVRGRVREDLILAFMPVVEHLARRHGACQPATRADLVQVGTIGLINAIDRWDPERARGDFLGYLVPYVRGEILRYFRDRTWSLRVPRRLKDLSVAINRCTGPLSQKLTRAPQPAELAEHLGVDLDEVLDALEAQASYQMGTLDALNCDSNTSAAERIGEIDADLDLVEYRHALRPLLEKLPERERTILILRFFRQMTQTQIAQQIGISQMHVSRLLSATLAALRSALLDDSPPEPRAPGPARRPANNRRP